MKPDMAPYHVCECTMSESMWSRTIDRFVENVPSVLLNSLSSPSHMRFQAW